jgi:hypothetical protein
MKKAYKKFTMLLDEETESNLIKQAKKYKKTKSDFVRDLINKRVNLKSLKNLERVHSLNAKVAADLSRVTGNINQIAYQLNKQELVFDEEKFNKLTHELIYITKTVHAEIKNNNTKIAHIL